MKTTTPKCPACSADSRDWSLCKACTNTLLADLRELPDVMRDLQDKRIGRTVMPAPANLVGNPDEAPVPFSDHARRVTDTIVSTIGSWIRALTQDAADLDDLGPTMPSWCAWLAARIDRIRFHEAAGQIADDIGDCCARARKAVDLPPELMLVQKCPTCGHGIFAGKDEETVVCVHCKRAGVEPLPEINVAEARGKLDGLVEHQWATRAQCALVLAAYGMPVKEDTISAWARPERGRLQVRGWDSARRPLYRVGDVADLVRAATRRATSTQTCLTPCQHDFDRSQQCATSTAGTFGVVEVSMAAKSAAARGYGAEHRELRKRWADLFAQGHTTPCACQRPACPHHRGPCLVTIGKEMPWDLGHTDDRRDWTGPECIPCNRSAGARNSNGRAGIAMTIRGWCEPRIVRPGIARREMHASENYRDENYEETE